MAITSYSNFKNPNIKLLTNANIAEYDMQDAGFSIIKEHKLLSMDIIKQLEQLPKYVRNIQIGQMQITNTELARELTELFQYYIQTFIEINNIPDENILKITRDSVMVVNRNVHQQKIDSIFFNKKNTYQFFYDINGIFIYYNILENAIVIKNMGDSHTYHTKYGEMFKKVSTYINKGLRDDLFNFLDDVRNKYLKKELPIEYYREFNTESSYNLGDYKVADCSESEIKNLKIDYNYVNIFLPLFRLLF